MIGGKNWHENEMQETSVISRNTLHRHVILYMKVTRNKIDLLLTISAMTWEIKGKVFIHPRL